MARTVQPVRYRHKDARAYYKAMDRSVRRLIFRGLNDRLASVESVRQAMMVTDEVFRGVEANQQKWLRRDLIQQNLDSMEGYHRQRLISTFRSALDINISSVLSAPEVNAAMSARVGENVDLIKTIPRRSHAGLKRKMTERFAGSLFDRAELQQILREEYKSTGYNLRRLTRDQTSKVIGQLTEIRHRQVGITEYEWVTSGDERVRETHAMQDGEVYKWSDPPVTTGHPGNDIQCRCTARPVISVAKAYRLRRMVPKAA